MSIHLDIQIFIWLECECVCVEIHCLRKLFALENHIFHRLCICAHKRWSDSISQVHTHTHMIQIKRDHKTTHGARKFNEIYRRTIAYNNNSGSHLGAAYCCQWNTHAHIIPFSFLVVKNLLAISVCPPCSWCCAVLLPVKLLFISHKSTIVGRSSARSCLGQCLILYCMLNGMEYSCRTHGVQQTHCWRTVRVV